RGSTLRWSRLHVGGRLADLRTAGQGRGTAARRCCASSGYRRPSRARGAFERRDRIVKLAFDDSVEQFRRSFLDWLAENAPSADETAERSRSSAHIPEWAKRWQRKMFDDGWLLPGHPPEFGG